MTTFNFLKTRRWLVTRRLILIGVLVFLIFRSYGDTLLAWLQGPNPARDIVITRSEFRPDLPGSKPAWIIEFRNESARFAYEKIELEATYTDGTGKVLEQDRLVVQQALTPGEVRIVGSVDFRERPGAVSGALKVLGAERVGQ